MTGLWQDAVGFWNGLSPVLREIVVIFVKITVIVNAMLLLFSVMTYVERRLLAFMQFRLGPNRTGPWGILQPIADGIKLFFKEEVIPQGAHRWLFVLAPAIAVVTAIMALAVVPYGNPAFQIADPEVGVLFLFAIMSVAVYAVVAAGWAANNRYSLMGGLRSSAQMFSYELALGLSWVGVILLAGSFRISDIVYSQDGWFWNWNAVRQLPAFLVYVVAATAEVNRTPFDLPEAETELVAGFHTEYSSMRFALLQMAEYVNMITAAAVGANLFFGGWLSPVEPVPDHFLWFLAKVAVILFFFIWLRGTVPRFRYDQLMHFGWKVLVPVAVFSIFLTAAVVVVRT